MEERTRRQPLKKAEEDFTILMIVSNTMPQNLDYRDTYRRYKAIRYSFCREYDDFYLEIHNYWPLWCRIYVCMYALYFGDR